MTIRETTSGSPSSSRGLFASLLISLPMMILTFMILSRGRLPAGPVPVAAFAATFIFFNLFFFLMVRTGKTDRYRAVLFITYAVAFVISFISNLIEARGTMALTGANMIEGQTPFCHIVIPMTLIPAALTRTIIFPGTIVGVHGIASMFVLWIGASLALGRGFCGWGCFFGGIEDGFSRLLGKPVLKRIGPAWPYLPFAVLLAVVLTSAISLSPTYCMWLCPFKTVTEYIAVTSAKIMIQTIIFPCLFVGLVIVLPILTQRRTQCGLFCPFGAFQSFTNKLNAFNIRIDPEKCVKCGRCMRACPTFSLDEGNLSGGSTGLTCMKCGKCVDLCPKGAVSFHIKGTSSPGAKETYRLLFLYPAFLFLTSMAGGNMKDAIARVVKLVSTGTMF